MARGRNIKPGFFHNEFLAAKSPAVRLLFIGLWTLADREGRLEDRPNRIKGFLFPYENLDINSMLDDLATISDEFQDHPFIVRYRVDGKRYIQICKFLEHQHPHMKEVASIIPPCPEVENQHSTNPAPGEHSASTGPAPENPVQAPGAHGASPSDSPFPFPLSIKGARASEPESSNSETEDRDWRRVFPKATIPKFILDDPDWMDWLRKWFAHLLEKSKLEGKRLTDITVQNHIDELAGRSRDRCIEVISHSISSHAWKLYWDHYERKPPAVIESKAEPPPKKKPPNIWPPGLREKYRGETTQ